MSKAEEAAYKAYPYNGDYRGQGDSNSKIREAYINGYHQAEKDLELGWKDMMLLEDILEEMLGENMTNKIPKEWGIKEYYQEVLKRFKEKRNDTR